MIALIYNGGLFRVLTNFTAVLCVNISLVRCIWPASWPHESLFRKILGLKVGAPVLLQERGYLCDFNLLGLLYHTAMHRKCISANVIAYM